MQKIGFKKDFRELYKASVTGFTYVEVPSMLYLMIDGTEVLKTAMNFRVASRLSIA